MKSTDTNENPNELNVSSSWSERFDILTKIGAKEKFIYSAMKSDEFIALSFREKQKITFNILAFIFGALYYFSKKMWFKGAFILGASWVLNGFLTLIEVAAGMTFPGIAYYIAPAVISAQLASYDFFKLKTEDEKIWKGLPDIFATPVGAIGFPLAALFFILLASGGFGSNVPECGSSDATNVVISISEDELIRTLGAEVAESISISVNAIRTTATNEQTGEYECAAQLFIRGPEATNDIPITYTIEMTNNGEEFYVNVFGL
ncbi:MAG: DUF2628 domain-containing protein [Colwellia sp.]